MKHNHKLKAPITFKCHSGSTKESTSSAPDKQKISSNPSPPSDGYPPKSNGHKPPIADYPYYTITSNIKYISHHHTTLSTHYN